MLACLATTCTGCAALSSLGVATNSIQSAWVHECQGEFKEALAAYEAAKGDAADRMRYGYDRYLDSMRIVERGRARVLLLQGKNTEAASAIASTPCPSVECQQELTQLVWALSGRPGYPEKDSHHNWLECHSSNPKAAEAAAFVKSGKFKPWLSNENYQSAVADRNRVQAAAIEQAAKARRAQPTPPVADEEAPERDSAIDMFGKLLVMGAQAQGNDAQQLQARRQAEQRRQQEQQARQQQEQKRAADAQAAQARQAQQLQQQRAAEAARQEQERVAAAKRDHPYNHPDANHCIKVVKAVRGESCGRSDSLDLTYQNSCNGRIKVKYCLQKRDGSYSDCGASTLEPGERSQTFSCDSPGRYKFAACTHIAGPEGARNCGSQEPW